jgi:hypothetical protein
MADDTGRARGARRDISWSAIRSAPAHVDPDLVLHDGGSLGDVVTAGVGNFENARRRPDSSHPRPATEDR